jgi:hypothetical protein
MRVTTAMGSDVLNPNTTVVTALLHSPDSRIGLRPNLPAVVTAARGGGGVVELYSFGSLGEVVGGWRRRASPVACKTPNQTARELREEEAGGY